MTNKRIPIGYETDNLPAGMLAFVIDEALKSLQSIRDLIEQQYIKDAKEKEEGSKPGK